MTEGLDALEPLSHSLTVCCAVVAYATTPQHGHPTSEALPSPSKYGAVLQVALNTAAPLAGIDHY